MYETDIIDFKIIDLLMEDGRMPAAVIARRVGENLTERVVRYRIKKLEKMGIMQIRPIVNPNAFGLTTRADVFLEVEADSIKTVAHLVAEYDYVTYVACSIGETDISLQIVGKNTDEIYRLVTDIIGKIPGVRKTTTSIVPLVLKDVYQWKNPRNQLNKS
jgi:Lrp/AsnC family transcriptional regulator, regulator for asnA, asnC and gidA